MIRSKLSQVLVFSSLAFLLVAAQPAAAMTSESRVEFGAGLWAEVRALVDDLLGAIGSRAPEGSRPSLVVANAGSGLDPDGLPNSSGSGAANGVANESH
jgi:hypothetical protein